MAVSAQALTLDQWAVLSNDPLVQAVTFSLIENGAVLQDIPLKSKKAMIANGVRWEGNLPTVNWAKLNTEPTVTSGKPTPFQEQAFLIRNAIDVDVKLVEAEGNIVDPRSAQIDAYLKAVTYDMNDKFINNNHISGQADSIVGIRARIDNGSVYGVRSENKIDAGALDITQAAATAALANRFVELMDQLLWSVDSPDGDGVVLYMNEVMKRRFHFLMRLMGTSGGFDVSRDQFDRVVTRYKGAVLRDIGYKADQSTRIITTTETNTGDDGSSTYTSIYAAHFDENHLFGWQWEPLVAKDLGLIGNAGTIYRTLVDYAFGLYNAHTRSIGRIYGLKLS